MEYLEELLNARETSDLQQAVRERLLSDEASAIAAKILESRGAFVPHAIPEQEQANLFKSKRRQSNKKFAITILLVLLWAVYASATGQFDAGQQERLNQGIRVLGLSLAGLWGWSIFNRRR